MKRLLSIILCFILLLSACPFSVNSASLSSDRIVKTEDMESHEVNKTLELNTNEHFCGFGTQIGNTIITDEFSHTGSKSLKQYGRHSTGATVKIHNLFDKKLTKEDLGVRYNISFYVYADKNSGVYKKSAAGVAESERVNYRYTEEEVFMWISSKRLENSKLYKRFYNENPRSNLLAEASVRRHKGKAKDF